MIELTPTDFTNAMLAARKHHLRAYDAVQLVVALDLQQVQQDAGLGMVTLISADRDLNSAATAEGMTVDDPNTH